MKLHNKSQRKSLHVALFAATLASTTIFPIITQQFNAAQAAPVPAKSADSFVDSIGVNTHFTYGGTPYERFDEMKSKLLEVGIRHIRDGGYNDPDFFNKLKDLGSVGIKSNIIFSGNSMGEVLDVVKSLSGAIEAVEGPNESDLEFFNFSYNGQKFPEGTRNYQQDLYHAIKNDSATKHLPVITPSMGWGEDADRLGLIDDWGDFCNMHNYPNIGQAPTIDLDQYFIPHTNNMCNRLAKWSTETGYHNELSHDMGISEEAAGKYIPRLLLESFNRDIKRSYLYEFANESNDAGDQSNYGLIRYDGSAKPAYTAIKNMTSLLKEPGANFKSGSLDYSLSVGEDRVHSTLLQKSNGEFYLILWQEANSWDNEGKRDIKVDDLNVTVNLNTPISRAEVYKPKEKGSPILVQDAPSGGRLNNLTVGVPDHPLIIKLLPNGVSTSSNSSNNSGGGSNNSGGGSDNSGSGSDNSGGGSESEQAVEAYQKRDFGGRYQSFSVAQSVFRADAGDFKAVPTDQISSLKVPQGLVAYVCDTENQEGCQTFTAGDYAYVGDDINNKISYMEVLPVE